MNIEQASAGIAASMGVATAVLQAVVPQPTAINTSLLVPISSAIIGGIMSYAVLRTTVTRMERDVRDMRTDMSEMYSLLRESMTKIAHLEGRISRSE
jgi:hypothetical protein